MSGQKGHTAVAVIGLAGRFPGAADADQLWKNLLAGQEAVRDISPQELQNLAEEAGLDPDTFDDPHLVKRRGWLDDIDRFDAPFFGINPREAELMDPQHRLFLEVAAQALDRAGHPDEAAGPIGVFAGTSLAGYLLHNVFPHLRQRGFDTPWPMILGNDKDHLATRVSYLLGLTGPSMLVQTACSTGLTAVHMARRALLAGECDLALAGASSVRVPQAMPHPYQQGGINSPDGRCRPYDAGAQGTIGGNGVAAVVLRRLDEALEDGDTVLAVIRGSALNNDGHRKVGYTAPSVEGQALAIRAALEEADIDPATVGYVEGHGTGTALGDPIEITALNRAYGSFGSQLPPGSCALGSVKSNLGHLDTAAGIAGLVKAVLAVRHGVIPPTVHFEEPSPQIPWDRGPFFVPRGVSPWPKPEGPRRAGVSSFGLGGTNVHVVLEQAPERPAAEETSEEPREHALVLSAKTATALERTAEGLAAYLREHEELSLAAVEHTLAVGRRSHRHRRVVFASTREQALAALEGRDPDRMREAVVAREASARIGEAAGQDRQSALEAWLQGATLEWRWSSPGARRIPLPPTAFDDHRFWVRGSVEMGRGDDAVPTPSLGESDAEPRWQRLDAGPVLGPRRRWWLCGGGESAARLAAALEARGHEVLAAATDADPSASEAGVGLVLLGSGWDSPAAASPELAAAMADRDGPSWWLTRSREAVFGAPENPDPGSAEEESSCEALKEVLEADGVHRLDLPPSTELLDTAWAERVADELCAAAPLRRGALYGRFRWSLGEPPRPAPRSTTAAAAVSRPPDSATRESAAGSRGHISTPFAAPTEELEKALAAIWEDLLGVAPVGLHDDFFELGGHSLLGTQTMARVSRLVGRTVPLEMLFETPVLGELARRLEAPQPATEDSSVDLPPLLASPESPGGEGEAPLSFAQQRLWFLDRLDPGNPAYNLTAAVRLRGALDVGALRRALNQLAQRQESLRTVFAFVDGRPVQRVLPAPTPEDRTETELETINASALEGSALEEAALALATRHKKHRFDLAHGPLWIASLLRRSEQDHELFLALHHIIGDGWSIGVLLEELAELYAAEVKGTAASLPPLEVQYTDYARWQRQVLGSGGLARRELDYWRQRLAGLSSMQDLPSDRPRPAVQTFRAGQEVLELPAELTAELQRLARRVPGGTLFMVLLAGLDVVLARHLGGHDIAVGTPVAGREHVATERLVGCFLNTLVLRLDLGGDPSFLELLERAAEAARGAYAHQHLPFEQLLESLQPERDLSRTPLFRVFLNLLNLPSQRREVPGLEMDLSSTPEVSSKFDITLYANQRDDRLRLVWVYNADLFDSVRMACMAGQLATVLGQAVRRPENRLSSIRLRGPGEEALLEEPESSPDAVLPDTFRGTVAELFRQRTEEDPQRPAILHGERRWSYEELDRWSGALARRLRSGGLAPGEIVAVWAHRSPAVAAAVLAVLRAGGVFMLLDPAYPPLRLLSMLELAPPAAWLSLEEAGPEPAELDALLRDLPDGRRISVAAVPPELGAEEAGLEDVPRGADDPACVTFTSGSTGVKAVLGRHGSLSHFMPWQARAFQLGADDRISMLSGLAHDPLQRDLFTPLMIGAALVIPEPEAMESPVALARWLAESAVTVSHLTPAMGQLLTQALGHGPQLPALRRVFFVGDRLRRHDVARLRAMAPQVQCINMFGSTESQRAVSYHRVAVDTGGAQAAEHEVLPLGRGMPGAQLLVLDGEGRPAGIGEVGEIVVRSPHLALGYLGDDALTAQRFFTDPETGVRCYRTGDLGRLTPGGEVTFAGRADQQIKIRGFRIEPGEVEGCLLESPEVGEAIVVARSETSGGTSAESIGDVRLVAYVAPAEGAEIDPVELQRRVRRRLPEMMVPSAFVVLGELPRTPNFKIDRRALPAPPRDRSLSDRPYEAPRNAKERRLERIFRELLGLERVGIHDDFFALGGHSLLMMQLVAQIQEMAGVEIPLSQVYREPTVAALARAVEEMQPLVVLGAELAPEERRSEVLVPLQPDGERPPLYLVHPGGGHLLNYRELARELAPHQPLFGLQAPGVGDGSVEPLETIEAMARRYLQAVRRRQPSGPYHLAGYCIGGLVAYEMAQQLHRDGENVAWLGILDTVARRHQRDADPRWVDGVATYYFAAELGLQIAPEELQETSPESWGDLVWERLQERAPGAAQSLGEATYRRLYRVFVAIRRAAWAYAPEPYAGSLHLFTPRISSRQETEEEELLGWRDLARGGIEHRIVPGSHTTMLSPPQLQVLAQVLVQELCRQKPTRQKPTGQNSTRGPAS
ncbi:MAG: amino acid adenylation domain-containing protein [Acidobacteriota bacterium]|nr:amino acid adenylation domain-containing protein [Acidobacteriota bacterium]